MREDTAGRAQSLSLPWIAAVVVLLGVLAAALYGPFYDNPLNHSDLHDLHAYKDAIFMPLADIIYLKPLFLVFRPVFWFAASAQYYFFGLNPVGYHLTSFSLHVLNATLVSLLAFQLTRDRRQALLAGLLFFLWYHHGDALFWAVSLVHLLGGFFFILSLMAYVHFRKRDRLWAFFASVALFYVAVFTNQATVSLVATCLLYDVVYRPHRSSLGKTVAFSCLRLSLYLPAVVLNTAISSYRWTLERRFVLDMNVVKNLVTVLSHPWYFFGPQGVTGVFRGSDSLVEFAKRLLEEPNMGAIVALVFCAFVTGALLLWRGLKGAPVERFGSAFYLLAFLPFFVKTGVDRRYFYLPLIGLTLFLSFWVLKAFRWVARRGGRFLTRLARR